MSEETRVKYYGQDAMLETGNKAAEGAAIVGTVGSVVGATLAAIAAVSTTLLLPRIGLVIAGP